MKQQLAYCTNVHAGSDLEGLRTNLSRYCLAVKHHFAPTEPMGVGLWIAASAARKLREPQQLADLSSWLATQDLIPFTLNGFPYSDFHEPVVKQRVYHPTWFESQRLDYTLALIDILHAILPGGMEGSISTLPIAWRSPAPTDQQWRTAAQHLDQVVERLARLEATTGRLITVCLEPEPGCVLQRCGDVLAFFAEHLCVGGQGKQCKRYIRVCHDICHSAVMFEDQRDVLARYAQQGIQVGKVQVSSAIEVDFDRRPASEHPALLDALAAFAEDRYLHQTAMRLTPDAPVLFFDDLPAALKAAQDDPQHQRGKWRIHFHVPIYLDHFNLLGTTQADIQRLLGVTSLHPELTHFEVETYAWSVLPPELQRTDLADGIADEMSWLQAELATV